ncbi:MAG: stage 0 sporulation family protein [Phycisphaerales bacterium JB050]
MSIFPLPQFEADLEDQRHADVIAYKKLKPPTSMVLRFGSMRLIGEFPYDGTAKPGCGSKIVATTHRGTEIGEMLTSTCPNAGCSKSVTRKEMLDYIDRSGGKDYPFFSRGRVLRVATVEDLQKFDAMREQATGWRKRVQELANHYKLDMKVVEVEPILGGELVTVYYLSEDRVDFRELVKDLGSEFGTRIEMRQIGARDEARLVADYEKCGQHCCCKQFLKVLKPISMRSAKIQKATLDPLKISGRCGRLMCCLRYEDKTYDELRKNLPRRKARVGTPYGPGEVRDTQILTQLVQVSLDHNREQVAVPVEELISVEEAEKLLAEGRQHQPDPLRGMSPEAAASRSQARSATPPDQADSQTTFRERSKSGPGKQDEDPGSKRRKSRRRRRSGSRPEGETTETGSQPAQDDRSVEPTESTTKPRRRRRKPRSRKSKDGYAPPDLRKKDSESPGDDSGSGSGSSSASGSGSEENPSGRPKRRRRRRPRGNSDNGPSGGGGGGTDAGGSD